MADILDSKTRRLKQGSLRDFMCAVIEAACATRNLSHKGTEIEAHMVHAALMGALAVPYATILSTSEFPEKQASQTSYV